MCCQKTYVPSHWDVTGLPKSLVFPEISMATRPSKGNCWCDALLETRLLGRGGGGDGDDDIRLEADDGGTLVEIGRGYHGGRLTG